MRRHDVKCCDYPRAKRMVMVCGSVAAAAGACAARSLFLFLEKFRVSRKNVTNKCVYLSHSMIQ